MDTDRSRGEKKKRKVDPKNELLLKFWLETEAKKKLRNICIVLVFLWRNSDKDITYIHIECHVF